MEEMMNTTMDEAIDTSIIEGTNGGSCDSAAGVAVAMLIGSGLTLAAIAIGKAVKKAIVKHKAKKAAEAQTAEVMVDAEYEEINDNEN